VPAYTQFWFVSTISPSHPAFFFTRDQEKIESRWHFWLPWDVTGKLNTLRCPLSIRMVALDAHPSVELGKTSWSAADASELARWICAKVGGFFGSEEDHCPWLYPKSIGWNRGGTYRKTVPNMGMVMGHGHHWVPQNCSL